MPADRIALNTNKSPNASNPMLTKTMAHGYIKIISMSNDKKIRA